MPISRHLYINLFILLFLVQIPSGFVQSQSNYVVVNEVIVIGNKKTKTKIILREMDMFPGDTLFLSSLPTQILNNEKRILSTALFTAVNINLKNWDTNRKTTNLQINVQENWYIYPSIIFELADRNFNVWWKEMNRDWSRVNYGLRLDHINLTGNRDRLKIKAQFGYTRKFELKYTYPYLNKSWGFETNAFYSDKKEIGYITMGNKTLFRKLEDERIMLSRLRLGGSINHRAGLFSYQALRLEYHHNQVDEFVAQELNPDYFLDNKTGLRFFHLEYDYQYDRRVFFQYPEGGYKLFFNIKKEGLGIFNEYNNLPVFAGLEHHVKHKKWIFSNRLKGKTTLIRDKIAFANNTGLGYGSDVITGYELYVIDGLDYLLWQSSVKYKIWDTVQDLGNKMPLPQYKKMSIRVFFRFNFSAGYVNEPTYVESNTLNNQWASGYGPAIDILLWNFISIKAEYSFNELGESGFFLKNGFSF